LIAVSQNQNSSQDSSAITWIIVALSLSFGVLMVGGVIVLVICCKRRGQHVIFETRIVSGRGGEEEHPYIKLSDVSSDLEEQQPVSRRKDNAKLYAYNVL